MGGGQEYCAEMAKKSGDTSNGVKIRVYMQDGRRFNYKVMDSAKAREHAHRIINLGWRTTENDNLVYYPVHQILKVVIVRGAKDAYVEYPTTVDEVLG